MSETFQGLRETLLQLGAIAADLHRNTPRVSEVARARDRLAERLALPDVPSLEEQKLLTSRFRAWLDGRASGPTAHEWGLAPFVYFSGQPPLCDDPRFSKPIGEMITTEAHPRIIKRALYAYFRGFDPKDQAVGRLGRVINLGLSGHHGRWSQDWKDRAKAPRDLFVAEGLAQRLAAEVCLGNPPRQLLREIGLSTELITGSGLLRPLGEEILKALNAIFQQRQDLPVASLPATLDFFEHGRRLRFPDLQIPLADQLLSPFAASKADPPDAVRAELLRFFEAHYGDPGPRSEGRGWKGVSTDAKQTVRRWRVRKSLDLFFDILSRTADPIWRYRRSFWLALHRHGLIEDAWPLFGRTALTFIRADDAVRDRLPGFGRLKSAGGDQSVMVMKLRGFIVAERSYAGACRIWSMNDRRAPSLGEFEYYAAELREDCLFSQSHVGPMGGSWQLHLSRWIAQRTGVFVPLSELMANTHA